MSINKMTSTDRKKRGGIFLAIAVVCMLLSVILPESNTLGSQAAVIMVSLLRTVASIGLLVFLIVGLYYLITGFTKKA
jgi:putative Mn2+ efflux pump MntP